ncbi:MAG TPA: EVE domain-containing protein [Steroidobacteraceae bacterium]|nr:EVE domain-containing protein [Steroidobacteraceae bacterium]
MRYWLLKSEPDVFSIDDLSRAPKQTSGWDGVRNYQVRNFMRDQMNVGDQGFFYHSSCAQPGIAGIVSISSAAYPDPTQFDRKHDHYDAASTRDNPRWLMMDVKLQRKFKRVITLEELRQHETRELQQLLVLKRGNRLSITPVTASEWRYIISLE